jgi:hypothetical protein
MAKTEFIVTRVTPEDKAAIVKLAADSHRTVANLINKLLADEMEKVANGTPKSRHLDSVEKVYG